MERVGSESEVEGASVSVSMLSRYLSGELVEDTEKRGEKRMGYELSGLYGCANKINKYTEQDNMTGMI